MLNGIKDQIKKQKEMLEAAEIIFEDGSGRNIDDQIVLGQTAQPFNEDADPAPEDDGELKLDGEEGANPDEGDGHEDGDGDDTPIDTADIGADDADPAEGQEKPEDGPSEPDDIGNEPAEEPAEPAPKTAPISAAGAGDSGSEPLPMPGNDLPEPVGRQTGDPAQDDNVVDVNLDLQSNTIRDVLPVPPAGAASAVVSDQMDQHVDSGFGGDGEQPAAQPETPPTEGSDTPPASPPASEPVPATETGPAGSEDIGNDSVEDPKPVTEAITLGGDAGGEAAPAAEGEKPAEGGDTAPLTAADAGTDPVPTEEPAGDPAAEPAPDEGEGENPVTAAVRDKVAESETPSPEANKEELLKKLGNITKNLEDAKKAVMSAIQ